MSALISVVLQPLKRLGQSLPTVASTVSMNNLVKPESFLMSAIRTKVRCYFPRPSEVKRVRRHGWEYRMSTPNGRKIIMRRILKGRHVLSH
ncbi:39S ribosomal protein L34, mitochondrial [Hyposmocoma kahamanoa]|uniref:39S ribosomal protein L34, mitochondrial n=1 Tax=Hyposmocoma kahamanoa TaxID=1477025 RepID=UPI000E6D73C2|nr:39S ribosomal protein L34, mitochondrial [Hyposmocoma kahamanoa]